MRVVVVGAGLGGLGAALRLQGAGHDVVVVEGRDRPGGRAYQLRDAGYTWDTGPSLVTMPWVLEETFAAGGLDLRREIDLVALDPFYRIFWAGEERHLDFVADRERMREEIARFSPRDAAALDGFLAALRPIYEEGILGAGRRPLAGGEDLLVVGTGPLSTHAGDLPRRACGKRLRQGPSALPDQKIQLIRLPSRLAT